MNENEEPKAEEEAPAPAAVAAEPEPEAEPKPEAEPEAEAAPKAPKPWQERALGRVTAQKHQLAAENARLTAELEAAKAGRAPGGLSEAEVEARATQIASQRLAIDKFNADCAEVVAQGKEQFPEDFTARTEALKHLADFNDPQQAANYNLFLEEAIATGEGARLLHALGGDLDEADRILSLPPRKRAIELAKMAYQDKGEDKGTSKMPKPVTPIGNRANHVAIAASDPTRSDQLSTKAWMERREKELRSKRA